MQKKYICYCGLYCENCAVKAKVEPAARVLYEEMKKAGFEEIIGMIPGGGEFWPFLRDLAETGACVSCREGSGNPGCAVRICAQAKGVEVCAACAEYPCALFEEMFAVYPILRDDNALLFEKGMDEWAKLQNSRCASGFTYSDK